MGKIKIVRFFFSYFFEILPKFNDFVNSDNCIGISHKNYKFRYLYL